MVTEHNVVSPSENPLLDARLQPKTYKRGMNPVNRANLIPYKPGENGCPGGNPFPITRHLKVILGADDGWAGRQVAERMVERARLLTGKSDAAILALLLDRVEGKVPGDGVSVNFNEIRVVVVEEGDPMPSLDTTGAIIEERERIDDCIEGGTVAGMGVGGDVKSPSGLESSISKKEVEYYI